MRKSKPQVIEGLTRATRDPFHSPGDYAAFKNLGIAVQRAVLRGLTSAVFAGGEKEAVERMVGAFSAYLRLAPRSDPQWDDVRKVVQSYRGARVLEAESG